jgi:Flp pilus assembly protein TadG
MNTKYFFRQKKGSILVLTAILMVVSFAILAFAVDLGFLSMVRTQLQRTADASALAATQRLLDGVIVTNNSNYPYTISSARSTATEYARMNKVLNSEPALAESNVTVGHLANPTDHNESINVSGIQGYNAVQVQVQRTSNQNGAVPLFFARVLGIDRTGLQAKATASFLDNISGFTVPTDGSNLEILPFALDEKTWDALMAGQGNDNFTFDPTDNQEVSHRADGIKETNLYPGVIDLPGNCGTIDIGNTNNSTTDISRQIENGISAQDLNLLGGSLTLPANLNGDTGISAGLKDNLMHIKGQPRILPLYSTVVNPGNNAQFTIVRFVGVRIMDIRLNASMTIKHVTIQPANVITKGAIPGTTGQTSKFVYSNVCLVR